MLLDALCRLAYRLGFALMRLWWFLRRPDHHGAVVAVWHGGQVLILRQSYRRALVFPGGGIGRGETPESAAARELAEEVGLEVAPEALSPAREMTLLRDWRRDHVVIFELHLAQRPELAPDRREIVEARFMTPAAALAADLSPAERVYLAALSVA